MCVDACTAATMTRNSVGCDYYATHMDLSEGCTNRCFAAIVTNAWKSNAHIAVDYGGTPIDLSRFAKVPRGAGLALTYTAFDPSVGLASGDALIIFLADVPAGAPFQCPTAAARGADVSFNGTGRGRAFHIHTDIPVVAYQMLPYGGGSAAFTGASLLIPTSAWGPSYIAVNAYGAWTDGLNKTYKPSLNLVAAENNTTVTVQPKVAILGASGVAGTAAGVPVSYLLDEGEMLQITQAEELSGSPIGSDKPIGLWAGHQAMQVPIGTAAADHGEQQIPPVRALGNAYVAVSYRPRTGVAEKPPWRFVGAANGTALTFDPPISGAPTSINLGDVAEVSTGVPFVVRSQDALHSFLLLGYMTGAKAVSSGSVANDGYGDPDLVRIVPSAQYLDHYVFFTDPTYPETNLVVVRRHGASGFAPVTLDCAGELTGFQPVGSSGDYEYTRIDLVRHGWVPQGNCDNGRHAMSSAEPFGLWVWGWGTPETDNVSTTQYTFTKYVSYGYPAGEGLTLINEIVVPVVVR
jgi:hypothetical protein